MLLPLAVFASPIIVVPGLPLLIAVRISVLFIVLSLVHVTRSEQPLVGIHLPMVLYLRVSTIRLVISHEVSFDSVLRRLGGVVGAPGLLVVVELPVSLGPTSPVTQRRVATDPLLRFPRGSLEGDLAISAH